MKTTEKQLELDLLPAQLHAHDPPAEHVSIGVQADKMICALSSSITPAVNLSLRQSAAPYFGPWSVGFVEIVVSCVQEYTE